MCRGETIRIELIGYFVGSECVHIWKYMVCVPATSGPVQYFLENSVPQNIISLGLVRYFYSLSKAGGFNQANAM